MGLGKEGWWMGEWVDFFLLFIFGGGVDPKSGLDLGMVMRMGIGYRSLICITILIRRVALVAPHCHHKNMWNHMSQCFHQKKWKNSEYCATSRTICCWKF